MVATDVDAGRMKVEVSKRVAERASTYLHFEIRAVDGSVFEDGDNWSEYGALKDLLDCDVLVNAADPATVRCTMGRLALAPLPVRRGHWYAIRLGYATGLRFEAKTAL